MDFFTTRDEFQARALETIEIVPESKNNRYWANYDARWTYHARAIEIIREIGLSSPEQILELGTMGNPLVRGGHIMDYDKQLEHLFKAPDVQHDARRIPWPIETQKYEWFVALRVFHHLWPVQRECFEEARRIARNVLLVVPAVLPLDHGLGAAQAIGPAEFRSWNGDKPPMICEPVGNPAEQTGGMMFVW